MSETEEMYLITIAKLSERREDELVPLAELASELSILPASVNQMVHKLEQLDLLRYAPYHGVHLTDDGKLIANRVLRRRHLWELFLVRCLNLLPQPADDLACRLEHITPPDVADRLSTFLGDPVHNSQGLPIPPQETNPAEAGTISLVNLAPGQEGVIDSLPGEDSIQQFLHEGGLHPGSRISVLASVKGGQVLIDIDGRQLGLRGDIAEKVQVKGLEPTPTGSRRMQQHAL